MKQLVRTFSRSRSVAHARRPVAYAMSVESVLVVPKTGVKRILTVLDNVSKVGVGVQTKEKFALA